jgi:hypothetical protein
LPTISEAKLKTKRHSLKVVRVNDNKIQLAWGEKISKEKAAKLVKLGKRKLYVSKPANKLTTVKTKKGKHHVRVIPDKKETNNLGNLPSIKRKDQSTIMRK